ncbi:MAG: DUF4234 domain-containing protein [Candidatus Poribacteria bacterium]|nr:DUF4234 domain-containing protein [Candidatus Poribacteria bacterium]
MHIQDPYQNHSITQNIGLSVILSILTFGIYFLYWQYKQMKILNSWLGKDEYFFWRWFFLCIITCGIYEVFEEYKMSQSINWVEQKYNIDVHRNLPITAVLLTLIGLGIVTTAIQQHYINNFYEYYLRLLSRD